MSLVMVKPNSIFNIKATIGGGAVFIALALLCFCVLVPCYVTDSFDEQSSMFVLGLAGGVVGYFRTASLRKGYKEGDAERHQRQKDIYIVAFLLCFGAFWLAYSVLTPQMAKHNEIVGRLYNNWLVPAFLFHSLVGVLNGGVVFSLVAFIVLSSPAATESTLPPPTGVPEIPPGPTPYERRLAVLISSTRQDLVSHRKVVEEEIYKLGMMPIDMDTHPRDPHNTPREVVEGWVDKADVYVGILGMRYGSVHEDSGLSFTELEYRRASKLRKPMFLYIIDDKAQVLARDIESDPKSMERLKSLKQRAMEQRHCDHFLSTEDLRYKVHRDLGDYQKEQRQQALASEQSLA